MPVTAPAMLEIRGVSVRAGGRAILQAIDATLAPGELVGLIGPSGAGKSTLMRVLLGLQAHDGTVRTGAGSVGWVPQDDALFRSLPVRRWLDYAAQLRLPELDGPARAERIAAVAAEVGLEERLDVRIGRLSGGQRKRVSVATELLTEPAILILDEPTSGLDPGLEARMMASFAALAATGRIVLVATHAMQSLDRCDRLWVLVAGRLEFAGPPRDALTWWNVATYAGIFERLAAGDRGGGRGPS